MFIFPLIGIVLLIGTAAAAQDPLADRGNWALGVALPSSSGLDLSLWKVHSPVTALGLEIDVSSLLQGVHFRRPRQPRPER